MFSHPRSAISAKPPLRYAQRSLSLRNRRFRYRVVHYRMVDRRECGETEGRGLRKFAFQCFVAAREACEPIMRNDYLALAARLVRRTNEKMGSFRPSRLPSRRPKSARPTPALKMKSANSLVRACLSHETRRAVMSPEGIECRPTLHSNLHGT
jgi:hypothetical protein